MIIYIEGLPSSYEVEHLIRLFYPRAPIHAQRPSAGEDCICATYGEELCVSLTRAGETIEQTAPLPPSDVKADFALASLVYDFLRETTGIRPPWGKLTGVRPVRMIHDARRRGKTQAEIDAFFLETFDCSREKYTLAQTVAQIQAPIIDGSFDAKDYSLYIGIPFCPTRCSYCSFVSCNLAQDKKLVQPYVDKLCEEIAAIRAQAEELGLTLRTIYIGGGTPTSLSAAQLRQMMGTVRDCFDLTQVDEYTVEAGRPDCTDKEKLTIIKEYGATRISINPQTFSDAVLARIGRKHSAEDIRRCYREAREAGHTSINMDLIAGLPGDTVEGFIQSLEEAIAHAPENITVHTLTLKRASRLVIEGQEDEYADVTQMLAACSRLLYAGYRPYYLYRQKNTLQNLENIGWCKQGHEGHYNIYIMEEVHTILSAGAGGSTKLVYPSGKAIERVFNFKYPTEYINRFEELLERKKGAVAFYGGNFSTQTPCGD